MHKFALISDIHFGSFSRTSEFSIPGIPTADETEGGVPIKPSIISLLKRESIDGILIAGDLSSSGKPYEIIACEKHILEIASSAGVEERNVIWSVGNHDIDWDITQINNVIPKEVSSHSSHPDYGHYYQLIAAHAPQLYLSSSSKPDRAGIMPLTGIYERSNMLVFVLNSGVISSQNQTIKHGKLTTNQLDWFRNSLRDFNGDSRWKVVLLHHHPFNYPYPLPGHDISVLEEGSELVEICGEYGVNLICHGHRHHPKAITRLETGWANPITFICAGSLSVNSLHRNYGAIPNTIHIVELFDSEKEIILKNYEYSTTEGWVPIISKRAETPIEPVMTLGTVFKQEEIVTAIHLIVNSSLSQQELPKYEELPRVLRSLSKEQLNTTLKVELQSTHKVFGNYPEQVVIFLRASV